MSTEQTTIKAIVRNVDGKFVDVEVEQGGCGRCHEEGGCGGQQLTQMFCSGPKTHRVENTVDAEIGDRVTLAIAAGSVRRTANFAYILPLTVTIVGALIGALFGGDANAMIGAGLGLTIAYLYVITRSHGTAENLAERTHIVSRS